MTPRHLLVPLATLALLAPLAGAHGPFTGTVGQGEKDTYHVDHQGDICAQVLTSWVVTLTWTPRTNSLTLTVPGRGSDGGFGGFAEVRWTSPSSCDEFDVVVEGTLVIGFASYTATVNR